MKTETKILSDFLRKKGNTFLIPWNQRNYDWKIKDQINHLMKDIDNFMDDNKSDYYFLGSIVLKENADQKLKSAKYVLVDGQQRITTFLLMFSALYDMLKIQNLTDTSIGELIEEALNLKESEFKLQRINDDSIIKDILSGKFNSKLPNNNNYVAVYKLFKKEFNKMFVEGGIKKIKKFYKDGISKIEVNIISLEQKEDEFLVFETINSRGLNLSSADLIKNHIMSDLKNSSELQETFENDFIFKAKDLQQKLKQKKLKQEVLEQLYRQILAIETGILLPIKGKDLYYGFKKWKRKKGIEKIDQKFINNAINDLTVFDYIYTKKWDNKKWPLVKDSLITFYPLIHLTVKKNSIFNIEDNKLTIQNEENIEYVLNYLTRFIIARTLCGYGPVSGNKECARLSHQLKKALEISNQKTFKEVFKKTIIVEELENPEKKYKMPSLDKEVKRLALERDLYSSNPLKYPLKWILIVIEQNLNNKNEELFDPLNIEIKPRKIPTKTVEYTEQLKMNAINHTIGNLLLTWKNEKLKKQSNYKYFKINELFHKEKTVNSDTIKKRTNEILDKIYDLWFKS